MDLVKRKLCGISYFTQKECGYVCIHSYERKSRELRLSAFSFRLIVGQKLNNMSIFVINKKDSWCKTSAPATMRINHPFFDGFHLLMHCVHIQTHLHLQL